MHQKSFHLGLVLFMMLPLLGWFSKHAKAQPTGVPGQTPGSPAAPGTLPPQVAPPPAAPPPAGSPQVGPPQARPSGTLAPRIESLLPDQNWLLADDAAGGQPLPGGTGLPNVVCPTLGGLQFWSDVYYFHQWHIQRHCYTGHHRLLDGHNLRHAWGSLDDCLNKLDEIKRRDQLPPMQGKAVVLLHGLIRTGHSMSPLAEHLKKQGGYTVFCINYPSTRAEVGQHAADLKFLLDHLDGISEIHLVSHSLGSLVIRHYLHDNDDPAQGRRPDPRLRRIVMMGAPNQGAEIAEKLGRNQVFTAVFGPAGRQLARQWPDLEPKLAVPQGEFAIIAGGRGTADGFNPLLSGDDDGVVSVAATRLPGARDFVVLPLLHSFMMNDATVQEYTLRFLEHGYLISPEARSPIPAAGNPL